VNFNIFMLIKCAFVGQKNFDKYDLFRSFKTKAR
jgi:hypothetical protein